MGVKERKNVVVVGAGANVDFGLPVGNSLKEIISRKCASASGEKLNFRINDGQLSDAASLLCQGSGSTLDIHRMRVAASAIEKSMPIAPSIDNFLHTNRDFSEIVALGKMAIVAAIGEAERQSKLFVSPHSRYNQLDFSLIAGSWLSGFSRILLSESTFEGFCAAIQNIHFVTFNYDRCIEQFFVNLARVYFPQHRTAPKIVLETLKVTHVYGSLGLFNVENSSIEFGFEIYPQDLTDRAGNIRIFTEGAGDEKLTEELLSTFVDAEVLMFLGFGFHRLNLGILPTVKMKNLSRLIFTNRGLSKDGLAILVSQLATKFEVPKHAIYSEASSAADVFNEYSRFLSATD